MSDDDMSDSTLRAIANCLHACAHDDREPERYREWYTEALDEFNTWRLKRTPAAGRPRQ